MNNKEICRYVYISRFFDVALLSGFFYHPPLRLYLISNNLFFKTLIPMRGRILIFFIVAFMAFFHANAQRYRNQSDLGYEEMVKFIAWKNGDIVEFNWEIKSTRNISAIELKKGNMQRSSVEWETIKKIKDDEKKYVDYVPNLGKVFYKLIVIDDSGRGIEYDPVFKVKKDGGSLL